MIDAGYPFSSSSMNISQRSISSLHAPLSLPSSDILSPSIPPICLLDMNVDTDDGLSSISQPSSFPVPTSSTTNHTEPNGAFLRPHVPFKVAAFNVRTLMRVGQQTSLARTLETLAIDVCCVSETRIQNSGSVIRLTSPSNSMSKFYLRLSGDPEASASGQAGVGVALSPRAEAALLDWIPVNSRLCAVRLEGSCRVNSRRSDTRALFVVSAYAPTDCSPDTIKDVFYQQLHELLHKASRTDIVLLAGDLNARVGRLSVNEARLGGQFGLDNGRSDNGNRLLHLCADHGLFLASTNFRHSKRRAATWRPPSSSHSWTQIDHIAISYRWRGCVQDCRSYWSTCLDSDHALVCAKLTMRFGGRRNSKPNRLDLGKLSQPAVVTQYQHALADKLACIPSDCVDQHWFHVHKALNEAALSCCGSTNRAANHWVSTTSLEVLDSRRLIPADSEYDIERRSLTRQLRASLKRDREAWWTERAKEMEEAAASGDSRKLFRLIRVTGPKRSGVSETVCEEDGTAIHNLQRRLERWSEHFQQQFNWPSPPVVTVQASGFAPWSVSTDCPIEAEIRKEIQLIKRRKAPGSDGISPALFKDGGNALIKELTILFAHIWESEQVPLAWGESFITPVFKKGSHNACGNYRGISLIPVASKLLSTILLRRLTKTREEQIREEQAGFRPGRGCVDQIFAIRQLLEHRHAYRRPTIVVFLDIRAAFDSLDRTALWQCLVRFGMPEKYVNILKALYTQTSGRVRAYGKLSPSFAISSGVRQGCPISPFLFNFAVDDILNRSLEGLTNAGVELLPGNRVLDLEYADDIALLSDNTQAIQNALNRLAIEVSRYGMHFGPSKCKVLLQDWQEPVPAFTIGDETLETVESFVYLGSCIVAGGVVGNEVDLRISKARLAFVNLRHLWRRRDIRLSLKGRVYSASVRSVLLYGCETWPLLSDDVHRLSVFDHRCLRSIARIWWQHHVSNDEVRRRVLGFDSPPLNQIISHHRLRWLGHVLRMPAQRLPRRAMFALPGHGWKKQRGGQPMTWSRGVKKTTLSLASVGSSRLPGWGPKDSEHRWLETLEDMAQSRSQWRVCCTACAYV
jgi:exonuclease III